MVVRAPYLTWQFWSPHVPFLAVHYVFSVSCMFLTYVYIVLGKSGQVLRGLLLIAT